VSVEESIRIVNRGDIALIEWDLVGEKVNKLSTPVMRRFVDVINELKSSHYKAAVMISRKPRIFIAGADIAEIKNIKTEKDAEEAAAGGQKVFNMIEDLPIPVVAAVHGACMGGGCEMILACDYRVCSDDPSTKIGLPETKLGIIPGFGGCVRLPRVIGLQASLDIILAGKAVDGRKAQKLGLVEKCVPSVNLEEAAMKMAQKAIRSKDKKRKKSYEPSGVMPMFLESFLGRPIVFKKARESVLKLTKGLYPAPLKAIDVIQKTYGSKYRDQSLEVEAKAFGEVAITDVSKNLIHLFYLVEGIKKKTGVEGEVPTKSIRKMAVLGAGTMGGGIAQLGADKSIDVIMKDLSDDAIKKGYQAAEKIWKKAVERRKLSKVGFQHKMDRIQGSTTYDGFKGVDLVIEAIVEDMNIKKKVIAECAAQCSPDVIIATNTSSLSVTEMSEGSPRPENFVGMHFFNPVDKMPLIEVIRGEKTSDVATATIFELSKKLGKYPVVVKDGPGFLVNRLLLPYLIEAVHLVEEGCSIEALDKAYLNFGMPMGPCHLIDEIGIDVCLKVAKIFHGAFGERAAVPPSMAKVVELNRLGKKNGRGFYLYDEKGKKLGVDQTVYKELGLSQPTNKISERDMVQRGIFAMINEAALAFVKDRIVEKAEDVDLAMIMGTGFPPFRGGLLRYADSVGSSVITDELEVYASKVGSRFKPSAPLAEMAKSSRTFY